MSPTPQTPPTDRPLTAGDDEIIERGLRMIRTYDSVRFLRDALSATTARLSGYDWNADPDSITKQQGDAFSIADRVFADLKAAVDATPEIDLPECQTCGGTGKIEEAAKTEGANQHSACVRTCDDCDGCGFAPDAEELAHVSRPATSAASEGEGDKLPDGAISGTDDGQTVWLESSTGGAHKLGVWGGLSLRFEEADGTHTIRDYVDAALASPPVSERERELEAMITVAAALDLAKACLAPSVAAGRLATWAPAKVATDYIEEAQSAAQRRIQALTAQPAGEGK